MTIKMVPDGTGKRIGRTAERGGSGQLAGMKVQAVLLK